VPNNHVFHTLLVWVSVRLFGYAEWAIRLPAFLAGLGVVAAVYVSTRMLVNRDAALLACAVAAGAPALVLYSTNARGYGMVCFAFVILVTVANELAERESTGRWVAFAVILALGLFTIPVMLYPGGAVTLWLVVERWLRNPAHLARFVMHLSAALVGAVTLAAAAYAPVIIRYGLAPLVGNRFVTPLSWSGLVAALPGFAEHLRETLGLGIPRAALIGLAAAAAVPFVTRPRDWKRLLTLYLTVGAWCVILLVATRRPPPGRVWLFLLPLGCLAAGIGMAAALAVVAKAVRAPAAWLSIGAAAVGLSWLCYDTVARRTVFNSDETVALLSARAIAADLLADTDSTDRVVYTRSVDRMVDYYLFTNGRRRIDEFTPPTRSGRLLLILNEAQRQTPAVVQADRRDISWSEFEAPTLLHQYADGSIYEARRRH
jgi:hypothetical protein